MIRILLLIIPLINGCTKFPNDTIYVVSTPGELIEIDLGDIFDQVLNTNSQYKIYPEFDYVRLDDHNPIDFIKKSEYTLSLNKKIIQQKQFKSTEYLDFTYRWSILSRRENMYFIEYNSELSGATPLIDTSQQLNLKVDSTCYDVVQLLKVHIIECSNTEGDYFAILEEESLSTMQIQKATNLQRKIDQLDNILIRTLTNYLEVYQLLQDNQLVLQGTLTSEILRALTQDNTFNLEIVDFKIHTNTQITILNQQGQLLILEFNIQSKEWVLYKYILTEIDKPYGYDLVFDENNIGTYELGIISDTSFQFWYSTTWYTVSWNIKDLNNDINSKVYLSFSNYILLQNEKSLSLYQHYSNIPKWSINQEEQTFVHQYPHFQSFLLFIQPYFYAYNYLERQLKLQFQSDKLINEYVEFLLEKITVYQQTCKAKIYFKVVDKSSTEIYQTSLAPQITCIKDQYDLYNYCDYIQQYQGQNIQLEFDQNDVLELDYNLTIPFDIYFRKDSEKVIYRKILNYNHQFVVIEQIENMQLKAYVCSEQINNTPLNCQITFQIDNFVELIDSPVQSWYYDLGTGIIFASAHGNSVDIYSNFKSDKFKLVITFSVSSAITKIYVNFQQVWLLCEKEFSYYSLDFNDNEAKLKIQRSANNIFIQSWVQVGNVLYNFITDQTIDLEKENTIIDMVDDNLFFVLVKKNDKYFGYTYQSYYGDVNHQKFFLFKSEIDLSKYKEITIANQENCQNSGFSQYIYLKALRDESRVLLFYHPQQNSINSQYFELKISENTQISTCDQSLFLTDKQNQNLQQYLIIDHFTQAIHGKVNKELKQIQFQQIVNLSGRIFNQFNSYQLSQIPINLLNRGTDLFATVNQLNFTYVKDGLDTHCFNLGQSWYSGQAFEIDLKDPVEDVQYKKTLIKQTQTIQFSQSIMEYDINTLVQLMENKIVLVSKADFNTNEFPLDDQYKFTIIQYIYDDLIYVQAQKGNYQNIFCVINCKDYNCQLQDGCHELNSEGKILYLNQHHFFMEDNSRTFIRIYDTKGDPSNILEFRFVDKLDILQNSNSIDVSELFENIYLIISIDKECQLNVINLDVSSKLRIKYFQYFKIKNVEPLLNNPKSQCSSILVKKDEIIVSGIVQPTVILKLEKQCNQNYCLISIKSKSLIQMYAMHQTIKDNFNENIYSMYFLDQFKKQFGLFFYDTTDNFTNLQPNLAIAYLPIESENQTSIVYNYNGQLNLLIAQGISKSLEHYILKRSLEICSTKSVNKDLQFILKNSYNSVSVQIKLNITQIIPPGPDPPGPDPTPDDKQGFPQWLLWSIVGGVILGICIGITIWYCKKKKPDPYDQL
ncbi:unnamed protein product [Paramecium sonneborni]|uniref:Transmembrane protein n=1 Tax=Paramecium sonneborni TaxID=65129 RepID=A0A8S1LE46_9CILI|nr:unnamed protein product [Paramecium sonneborni]